MNTEKPLNIQVLQWAIDHDGEMPKISNVDGLVAQVDYLRTLGGCPSIFYRRGGIWEIKSADFHKWQIYTEPEPKALTREEVCEILENAYACEDTPGFKAVLLDAIDRMEEPDYRDSIKAFQVQFYTRLDGKLDLIMSKEMHIADYWRRVKAKLRSMKEAHPQPEPAEDPRIEGALKIILPIKERFWDQKRFEDAAGLRKAELILKGES